MAGSKLQGLFARPDESVRTGGTASTFLDQELLNLGLN
jgi:hypothetical protein